MNPGSCRGSRTVDRYTRPLFFDNSAFNAPLQPVVGLCWHEARAYCAWLSAQTDRTYRLPTEHEWEAAARGQARRPYAYDGQFDPAKGNTAETRLKRTTPIGVFPEGDTPDGISDLTGNSAGLDVDRAGPGYDPSQVWWVVRGGCWLGVGRDAHNAARRRFASRLSQLRHRVSCGVCLPHPVIRRRRGADH